MDIHNIDAKEVLNKSELAFYERGMEFFYSELVHLNVNLFIMDKIADFRFDLFTTINQRTFFNMVFRNFFYYSLLIITRIAADQGSDVFTLPRFKNRIRQASKQEYRDLIDNRLRQVKFDMGIQKLLEKTKKFRSQSVAHSLEEVVFGNKETTKVFYSDLKKLRDQLNDLLDALSFNVEHMMLPIQYLADVIHPKHSDPRSDIERILDNIAEKSVVLTMPEKQPQGWKIRKSRLKKEDLEIINHYRIKLGIGETPIIEFGDEI